MINRMLQDDCARGDRYWLIADTISALLLLLFLYTALSKLAGYKVFAVALKDIPLIGRYASLIAWLLPVSELLIAILLFFSKTRLAGLFVSFIALLVFSGYLLYMIMYVPHLPCNCGGVLNSLSWKQHIIFNAFFLLINILGIRISVRRAASLKRTPP